MNEIIIEIKINYTSIIKKKKNYHRQKEIGENIRDFASLDEFSRKLDSIREKKSTIEKPKLCYNCPQNTFCEAKYDINVKCFWDN